MLKLLLQWLVSLFTADKVGVIVRKLLINTGTQVARDIFDVEHQKKAYLFVKELSKRDDLTNAEKASVFNEKMASFLKASGIAIAKSALNCLREMAVCAAKAEAETGEDAAEKDCTPQEEKTAEDTMATEKTA